jgi:hypothetical protein
MIELSMFLRFFMRTLICSEPLQFSCTEVNSVALGCILRFRLFLVVESSKSRTIFLLTARAICLSTFFSISLISMAFHRVGRNYSFMNFSTQDRV